MARDRSSEEITLGLLAAVESDSNISQRKLSSELGVALGLANSYLKRCVRKGLVKVQQVPRRRYAYYLTPQGFSEKARLTGEYLTSSLQFYRRARTQIDELMGNCSEQGWRRIALIGASELTEIATLTAHDHDVHLVGVVDDGADGEDAKFCGLPVVTNLSDLGPVDVVLITLTKDLDALVRQYGEVLGAERVLAPPIVSLARAIEHSTAPADGPKVDGMSVDGLSGRSETAQREPLG